jgi:hypothetical protein
MIDTTNVVWYCSISVQFFFCAYLVWTGLGKAYPTFTVCLGCGMLRSVAAVYFMRGAVGSRLPLSYTYFWLWSEPFWLLLLVAVALEVHTKIRKDHRTVLRRTRPLLIVALFVALFAAGFPLLAEVNHAGAAPLITVMHFEIQATQYISSVLAIFLLASAVLFLLVVHDAWHSSIWRHEGMLAVYFGVYATAALIIEMDWIGTSLVNSYVAAVLTLCFVLWITVFRPQEVPNN